MKIKELYNSVAMLGFETSLEYPAAFKYAANRAVLQVNSIRPVARSFIIDHRPLTNYINGATFEPIDMVGNELILSAPCGKSYAFEARGIGSYTVEKYSGFSEEKNEEIWELVDDGKIDSPKEYKLFRNFIRLQNAFKDGAVKVTFKSESGYMISVRCAAIYDDVISNDIEDIPLYEPYTKYNIPRLTGDFLTFSHPPVVAHTRETAKYFIENNCCVLLPYDARGLYTVEYNKKPSQIDSSDPSIDASDIEIDEELASLLPNLVAAYVWADDEPAKAEYYLTLYRERATEIERRLNNVSPVVFKDAYGW